MVAAAGEAKPVFVKRAEELGLLPGTRDR